MKTRRRKTTKVKRRKKATAARPIRSSAADLQKQLDRKTRELAEALEQQAATSETLGAIARSAADIQPVLDAFCQSAAQLCGAYDSTIWRRDGGRIVLVAHYGPITQIESLPLVRGTVAGRTILDATLRIRSLMEDVARTDARTVIAAHLASGMTIPGFGHPLYPEGDPRAAALLSAFDPPRQFVRMMETVRTATGQLPNLDFALLAMSERCGLSPEAPFSLFALGRCIGWLAHAIEQAATGQLIRPRASHVGPALDDALARQNFELAGSVANRTV